MIIGNLSKCLGSCKLIPIVSADVVSRVLESHTEQFVIRAVNDLVRILGVSVLTADIGEAGGFA
jgi:hypothetical protein